MNNFATTESEIVEMSLRLAGAGTQIGLSEAQIMSFAAALSSVGIQAEAGGSAFSKVMVEMQLAVETGSSRLKEFATVAGMSVDEFRKAFQEDASKAIIAFIQGLASAEQRGMSAIAVLDAMGISEVRLRDSLLRAAGASELFTQAIEVGNKAWDENTALTTEAQQRYETMESKLKILWNRIKDVAITLGDSLLPALTKALEAAQPLINKLAQLANWFANLDQGMQQTIIAAIAAVAALGPLMVVIGNVIKVVGVAITAFSAVAASIKAAVLTISAAPPVMAALSKGIALVGSAAAALSGPIGIAIAAIAALVAASVAAYKVLQRDSIKAVENFGEAAESSLSKASGSFKKFRSDSTGAMKDTAETASVEGEKIGKNLASGIGSGAQKGSDEAVKAMKDTIEKMKTEVDKNQDALNRLGDAIVQALKKQYDEMESAQTKSLNRQIEAEKKASEEKIKIYDQEYAEKMKLLDEETYRQVKAIQDQIDAIDEQTEAEEKALKEQEYQAKLAELKKQLAAAETAEERRRIQQSIDDTIADYERKKLLEQRNEQKNALKAQIDAIKENAEKKKEQLKQELEDQKSHEKERLETVQKGLDEELEKVKQHYESLKTEEALKAEARKLMLEENQDEIVRLLNKYNPKWQDAGQGFAESFAKGLNSEKQSIHDAVSETLNIAPVIGEQIQELDRLQEKLKELEASAKASGGGGLSDLAMNFDTVTVEAEEFATVVEEETIPAVESIAEKSHETNERTIEAFIGLRDGAMMALNELHWSGRTVTEETASAIADRFAAMGDQILEDMEANHEEQLKSLQTLFSNSKALTDEEKSKMMEDLIEAQRKEQEQIEFGQQRVFEILSNALDEQRSLTQAEYDEINRIQKGFTKKAEDIFKEYEIEQKALFERLRNESSEVTARQAADIVKNSKFQRDEAIKAAEDQYTNVIKEIIRQRDDAGLISADQADRLIREAQRQKNETIAQAEEMHRRVVEEAKKQAEEHVKSVDWETGEVLTLWQKMQNNIKQTWNDTLDYFRNFDLRDIGRNLIEGLQKGIESASSKIGPTLGSTIKNGLKNELQIHSPSRVMMGIGEDTAEGFEIGIKNRVDAIRRQAKAMAAATSQALREINSQPLAVADSATTAGAPHHFNFSGMFDGANFYVRSDNDITAIAQMVASMIQSQATQQSRGRGTS